ncbi:MAG: 50S ribosomal protein L21 [Spirochaetaceae bacterium]|jgi:large subunit ribosomal protein L21|nr:50S ribosomal protein L21 [Spirochaetaceae bacterium]
MYAIIDFMGHQYKAEKGALLQVDKLNQEAGAKIDIDQVLLVSGDDASVSVGSPYVKGASVKATVESNTRGKKVIVFKYMPKKDYRRKNGHRQDYSIIKIDDIVTA